MYKNGYKELALIHKWYGMTHHYKTCHPDPDAAGKSLFPNFKIKRLASNLTHVNRMITEALYIDKFKPSENRDNEPSTVLFYNCTAEEREMMRQNAFM